MGSCLAIQQTNCFQQWVALPRKEGDKKIEAARTGIDPLTSQSLGWGKRAISFLSGALLKTPILQTIAYFVLKCHGIIRLETAKRLKVKVEPTEKPLKRTNEDISVHQLKKRTKSSAESKSLTVSEKSKPRR